ncbi:trehalose-phosphatase [Nitrosococcus watsonii]|nr:trehalose-phosphatase [Nitrosococcus watsonii]
MVFEGAIAGVKAGRQGKFGRVIGVNRKNQAEALQEAGADTVIEDLAEMTLVARLCDLSPALEAMESIQNRIEQREIVVFLDYDGTLSSLVSRPEEAHLSAEMNRILRELANQCPVAIMSGRGLADVRQRVAIERLYYAGSHGFEIAGSEGLAMEQEQARACLPLLDEAEQALAQALDPITGAQIERKRFSIAVHYRNVAEDQIEAVAKAVDRVLESHNRLRKKYGKKVYELQPDVAWDKGQALLWLLDKLKLNYPDILPLYIGDDLTDEDAFQALEERGLGLVARHAPYRGKNGRALYFPGFCYF